MRIFTLIVALFACIYHSQAQSIDALEAKAKAYISEQSKDWNLNEKDIHELKLVDAYKGSKSGVNHLYFIQRWNGTDIYNAITGVHLSDEGKILYTAPRLHSQLAEKVNTYRPSISAETAVKTAARYFGIQAPETHKMAALTNGIDQDVVTFSSGNISKRPIPARLVYQPDHEGNLRLAWDLSIDVIDDVDWLSVRIDAVTGALLSEANWTVKCQFGHSHDHGSHCLEMESSSIGSSSTSVESSSYNVFPLPYESPLDGNREVVNSPADTALASPFGWHDTDGTEGAEFTITQGNNTHSFSDRNGDLSPDFNVDGGADLNFDFAFDQSLEPSAYSEAAATNLFYVINMIHDIAYHYGFDEAAGNFQATNYTGDGSGGDAVIGASQFDGANGNNINNATFSTPSDGGSGVMRMFEWNNSAADQEFIEVLQPAEVRGFYATGTAEFGPAITADDTLRGQVAIVQDGIQLTTDACEDITNGEDLEGKIVMIDRGNCDFSLKVHNAQLNGAIGVIICNNQGTGIIGMAGGTNAAQVTIPSLFMSREDCNELRFYAGNTLEVEFKLPAPQMGASRYDGSLDNGIIAHEYGHGISNRLTGGPQAANCLSNDEQMGEGWSDFFTLAFTAKAGDQGTDPKGIGNYVTREEPGSRGIRNYPYSTDMNINPQTYEDVILSGTAPHPLGEIWCAMLWDLHWALVDELGFDPDLKTGNGGNNVAIQLVMEGMALQPCQPGFTDGRDAILQADAILYNGAYNCLIWEVFARRGLGFSADQGLTSDRRDAKEAFDVLPACAAEMYLTKSVSPVVERGEEIEVTLELTNYSGEEQDAASITDVIPEGCTYVAGSASMDPASVSTEEVNFNLPVLGMGESITVTYKVLTPSGKASLWIEEQDFNESTVTNEWFSGSLEGNTPFSWIDDIGVDASGGFFIENTAVENDHYILNFQGHEISGDNPVLRFTHRYNTEPGADGGIVEISSDGALTFEDASELMFRAPYRGKLAYTTFAIVNQRGFWGDSEDWVTTYIDMSPYIGAQDLLIRFRFGSDASVGGEGWSIDDFHIFDGLFYDTEATVNYGNGLSNTVRAEGRGTIVQPDASVKTEDLVLRPNVLQVFPNPAKENIHIIVPMDNEKGQYKITDLQGRVVSVGNIAQGENAHQIPVTNMNSGIYFIELIQQNTLYTGKVIIQ